MLRPRFVPSVPYQVIWGITAVCNARCVHCYADGGKKAEGELSSEEALAVVDELAELGVLDLGFTGGEPLLRKDLPELVARATSGGLSVGISSNGFYLDQRRLDELRAAGLERVQVSIDGVGAAHDEFRGVPGLYRAAMETIARCRAIGMPVLICFTATRANLDQLEPVIAAALELGLDSVNISLFVPSGRGGEALCLDPEQTRALYQFWQAHREDRREPRLSFHTAKMALVSERVAAQESHVGCQAGAGTAYIDPRGRVTPCVLLPIPIGSLRERSFADIWRESALNQALRARTFAGRCGACELVDKCGGCRALAYARTGDPLADDPSCWRLPSPCTQPSEIDHASRHQPTVPLGAALRRVGAKPPV